MKKVINGILVLAIIGTLLFEVRLLTLAQDEVSPDEAVEETPETPESDVGSKCVTQLRDFMLVKEVEFGQEMNQHFRSPKPTSELLPFAIERFREFRADARVEMVKFLPHAQTITAAQSERTQCEKALREHFQIMKDLLRQHIVGNAHAKKSTRFLDKYKQINEKLERLNFTIAQTYGYFAALSQKLPCYASKCVK